MSGPELTRRLTVLRAYHHQLTREIAQVEAEWAVQYALWERTQADPDAVACVQFEQRVAQLRKIREIAANKITRYDRLLTKSGAWNIAKQRRPFGA